MRTTMIGFIFHFSSRCRGSRNPSELHSLYLFTHHLRNPSANLTEKKMCSSQILISLAFHTARAISLVLSLTCCCSLSPLVQLFELFLDCTCRIFVSSIRSNTVGDLMPFLLLELLLNFFLHLENPGFLKADKHILVQYPIDRTQNQAETGRSLTSSALMEMKFAFMAV